MNQLLRSAVAVCWTASTLLAQVIPATNLGGGCVPTGANGVTFVSAGTFPIVSCSPQLFCPPPTPSGSPIPFIFYGDSDPNLLLPSCGCVLHTSAELLSPLSAFSYPAAASGYSVTVQLVFLGAYAPVPSGVYFGPWPGPGGCTEAGLQIVLSDGYRFVLP